MNDHEVNVILGHVVEHALEFGSVGRFSRSAAIDELLDDDCP
ncbi:MAG: hypothetical protein Q8S43_06385 [Actinomycetota bacterium]|nr:hypothetical protein [Actinomycetota bacterium]